ncbi:hypothetical protein [Botrimarina mediterranea]|uniref:PEP-CTERM protein-sorting domain-containing protein n=1 Tax=Botrimarina mediterranea TaxID=2528022 RepID=A0A518KF45_9BACT|nr:hypothetical protein [Botrimarina mediterranea]QDV76403.1 hypothetical protein Spa11_46330 [Botrimarina mediterranea]QDV80999.1 hypothetical protein K2D_46340 [Planctomycetes bacterium K2D]
MNRLRRYALAALAALATATPGFAAEYRFDITDAVGPLGVCFGDCGFDLGMQFSRIDSADLLIRGVFEPGVINSYGDENGAELPFDQLYWTIKLGDAAFQDNVGNSKSFAGVDGEFESLVGLGSIPILDSPWLFLVNGPAQFPVDPADLAFLHDGEGHIYSYTISGWVDAMLVTPVVHFDQITLILNGVAVPEPSALAMGSLLLLASAGRRPCRAFLR